VTLEAIALSAEQSFLYKKQPTSWRRGRDTALPSSKSNSGLIS
jgi:hypothetical protein